MKNQTTLQTEPKTQTQTNNNFKKIGIFPGVFNPIHNGQLIAVEQVIDRYQLDAVFFCILENQDNDQQRLQMTQLAINGNSKFYTANNIYSDYHKCTADFLGKYQDAEIFLIVGADKLQNTKNFKFVKNMNQVNIIGLVEPKIKRNRDLAVEWFKFPRLDIKAETIRDNIEGYQTIRYLIPDIVAACIAEFNLYK